MTKFQKTMEQIAKLSKDAIALAENEEDRQTAVELKLAAECCLPEAKCHNPTRHFHD